ncbi:4-hydroxy-tetrahydrodipicolinate synthase [Paenibacillus donghaensis]|uniref:4-hydroxy-tetrahydrodipicolinate synthase n=1 Tax=Paenibacillus donghaensis TaxID=414771 RepID=A0A2Z2K9T7_9BACL|nr:4-hydroxy-tetrahydrodipicolinate synthase [Paenibacillus donghaensis]ASA22207.1 4-hydroxy-tetrahydrodipicolinate synthase [Paenibacillus donghaensis]
MDFGRLITAMVTPFDGEGEINWNAAAQLVDYLIEEQKSEALVVCGTTGESPTLSDEEKLQLFAFVRKQAAGRCKVIAGTGSNNTRHSIHLTQEAERIGVDGVLLVVPYYNKPNQEGLFQHFAAIAAATKLPVILYNVPGRTSVSMSVTTTLRLAEIPNIVATKECASVDQITLICAACPQDFRVYTGDDSAGLAALAVGGHGIISVASHVVGAQMSEMIASFTAGDIKRAGALHRQLFPVFKGLFECPQPLPNPSAVKYALNLRGLNVGSVRLPLVSPTEEEAAFIAALFK